MKEKNPNKIPYQIRISLGRLEKLFEALKDGMPLTYACDLVMIPRQVIFYWQKAFDEYMAENEGKEDYKLLEPQYDSDGKLVLEKLTTLSAVNLIKKMRAEYLKDLNKQLLEGGKDWQKFAWILERRYRDEYSKEEIITNKSEKVDSIKVVFVDPKQEEERLKKLEQEVKESIGASND